MLRSTRHLLMSALLSVACGLAAAADTPEVKAVSDILTPARERIAAKNWLGAIDELKRIDAVGNADWNNLMGYSLRKVSPPDLGAAEKFYNEALRLNPKHRGALEYSGELYLMLADLAKAEQRLAALDKVCMLPCEEYTDLKKAVARFKAAGNKYVAAP
jgi:opacity protein-like surface antigen